MENPGQIRVEINRLGFKSFTSASQTLSGYEA
ncbi:MAG: hypothetical protein K0Q60_4644, partial [Microvirga sp.]|nr:hypothetical protein [Microvirga sp.]